MLVLVAESYFYGQGSDASKTSAAHADCAARWNTHLAHNSWLATIVWVGSLLQLASGLMFRYCARRLMRRPTVFESEAAGERFIHASARVIGTCSMLGKLFVRPVIPWVLLSHAIFTYRCIGHYQGVLTGLISSFLFLMYVFSLFLIDHCSPSSA